MEYVLDSCVGFKWLLRESDTDKALILRDSFRGGIYELLAPDVFPIEIAHALTRAERQGCIPVQQSQQLITDCFKILPDLHSSLSLIPRAVELSSQLRIGVYDCVYVALAEREQCELVTADSRLVTAMQGFPVVSLDSL